MSPRRVGRPPADQLSPWVPNTGESEPSTPRRELAAIITGERRDAGRVQDVVVAKEEDVVPADALSAERLAPPGAEPLDALDHGHQGMVRGQRGPHLRIAVDLWQGARTSARYPDPPLFR
ncbi:MAG: hypothetical protein WAK93_18955 [Solirubrobacteraceae bacterium]